MALVSRSRDGDLCTLPLHLLTWGQLCPETPWLLSSSPPGAQGSSCHRPHLPLLNLNVTALGPGFTHSAEPSPPPGLQCLLRQLKLELSAGPGADGKNCPASPSPTVQPDPPWTMGSWGQHRQSGETPLAGPGREGSLEGSAPSFVQGSVLGQGRGFPRCAVPRAPAQLTGHLLPPPSSTAGFPTGPGLGQPVSLSWGPGGTGQPGIRVPGNSRSPKPRSCRGSRGLRRPQMPVPATPRRRCHPVAAAGPAGRRDPQPHMGDQSWRRSGG